MTTIDKIRAEIERLIRMNQTKNGFPAGTCCAIRIEAYEHLLSFVTSLQEEQKPKVIGYGVMRKMDAPLPYEWYMDESGKEHCWGYKSNEPCPWPAEVYIMEAKEDKR